MSAPAETREAVARKLASQTFTRAHTRWSAVAHEYPQGDRGPAEWRALIERKRWETVLGNYGDEIASAYETADSILSLPEVTTIALAQFVDWLATEQRQAERTQADCVHGSPAHTFAGGGVKALRRAKDHARAALPGDIIYAESA